MRLLSTFFITVTLFAAPPVVAKDAMMLVEEGKLRLADPVEKYLPEFRGQWVADSRSAQVMFLRRPARPVTLRDLMTHSSGMSTNPPESIKELHGALHLTLADVVLVESQQPLDFDPGTKWQYSNNGIAALARVLGSDNTECSEPFPTLAQSA